MGLLDFIFDTRGFRRWAIKVSIGLVCLIALAIAAAYIIPHLRIV